MLLLSSATRILATKRPPDVLHPFFARQTRRSCKSLLGRKNSQTLRVRRFFKTPQYWSIRRISRQSQRSTRVSEMDMALRRHSRAMASQKTRGAAPAAPLTPITFFGLRNYQGTILRRPFFFLLLDSFFESLVFAASVASDFGSVPAAAASLFGSAPAAVASGFAGVSDVLSAAGGFAAFSLAVE